MDLLDGPRVGDISLVPPTWIISLHTVTSYSRRSSRISRAHSAISVGRRNFKRGDVTFLLLAGGTLGCNVFSFIDVTAGCELITSLTVWLHLPFGEAKQVTNEYFTILGQSDVLR